MNSILIKFIMFLWENYEEIKNSSNIFFNNIKGIYDKFIINIISNREIFKSNCIKIIIYLSMFIFFILFCILFEIIIINKK